VPVSPFKFTSRAIVELELHASGPEKPLQNLYFGLICKPWSNLCKNL